MALTLEKFRALTDEQIVAMYDDGVDHVVVGLDFLTRELNRRAAERAARASDRAARATVGLSIVSTVIALAALIATVLR